MGQIKLESYESKKTEWEGLWDNGYSFASRAFSLSNLRNFKGAVRIIVRKNIYWKKGSKRPKYQFAICDSRSDEVTALEVTKAVTRDDIIREVAEEFGKEVYIRVDDAAKVANGLVEQAMYGESYDDLQVESCGAMMRYAITPQDVINRMCTEAKR